MSPLSLPSGITRNIRYLLSDVDDTITTDGRLLPETFQALHDLQEIGIHVIPVTGGCAGWCDQIARIWPVSAVIGENGAFYIQREPNGSLRYCHWQDSGLARDNQKRILETAAAITGRFPSLAFAKDQPYRLADVALDYNQDRPAAPQADVAAAIQIFRDAGINAKASSIHINAWIGDFNKAATSQWLLETEYGLKRQEMRDQVLYLGDAPNDEPMFEFFPNNVGVANIRRHWAELSHHPAFVTTGESGRGFAELARTLLSARI